MESSIRIGEIDGRLHFLAVLGTGGSATVYQARHLQLDKVVAVKILQAGGEQERQMRRFMREARVLCQIAHPNVVKVHSFEKSRDGHLLMVMEFVEGRSLAEELKQGSLPIERAVDIWRQVCLGMKAAHQHGIVHRDLKPSNIMLAVDDEGREQVKVVDFGIARHTGDGSSQSLTSTDSMLGSPAYMSPEQCQSADVDVRSDVYSLGCVMYECLCGAPPFSDQNVYALMSKHVNEPVPGFSSGLAIPAGLKQIIAKALSKSADDRFQNMQELIDALNESRESGYESTGAAVAVSGIKPKRVTLTVMASVLVLVVVSIVVAKSIPSAQEKSAPVDLASGKASRIVGRKFYRPDDLVQHNLAKTNPEIKDYYRQWIGKYPKAPQRELGLAYFYCSEAAVHSKGSSSEVAEYRKEAMILLQNVLRQNGTKVQSMSEPELIEIQGCLAGLCEYGGDQDRAESLFREAERRARVFFSADSGDRVGTGDNLGLYLHRRGKYAQAVEPFKQILQAVERRGNYNYESRVRKDLAASLFLSGHKTDAVEQLKRSVDAIKEVRDAKERADLYQQIAPTADMVGPASLAAECWLNSRRPGEFKLLLLNCHLSLAAAAALVRSGKFESAAKISREACESIRDCSYEDRGTVLQEILGLSQAYPKNSRDLQVADVLPLVTILCDGVEDRAYFTYSLAVYRQALHPAPAELVDKAIAFLKTQSSEDALAEGEFYVLLREVASVHRRSECIALLENAIRKLKDRGRPVDLHRAAGAEFLLASWYIDPSGEYKSSEEERAKALPLLRSAASYLLSAESATGVYRDEQIAWLLGVGNDLVLCNDYELSEKTGREACKRSVGKGDKVRALVGLASTYCNWGETDRSKYEDGLKVLESAVEVEGKIAAPDFARQSEIYRLFGCIYAGQRIKKKSMESFDCCLDLIAKAYPLDRAMLVTALKQKALFLKSLPHTAAELAAAELAWKRVGDDAKR